MDSRSGKHSALTAIKNMVPRHTFIGGRNPDILSSGAFKVYDSFSTHEYSLSECLPTTDAFGQVEFLGNMRSRAKYIRLSDQTDMRSVCRLTEEYMKLQRPILVISITGGMDHFHDADKKRDDRTVKIIEELCRKLAKVKKETWFITGGLHAGSTKVFAEAIGRAKSKNTHVIGLTPWKLVHNSKVLIQNRQEICVPTYYIHKDLDFEETVDGTPHYFLNQNHTHFFLVDTFGDHPRKQVIRFKNKYQGYIRNLNNWHSNRQDQEPDGFSRYRSGSGAEGALPHDDDDDYLPAIQLVINGGYNTIYEIFLNLFAEDSTTLMSVVIIAGTGGVADYLVLLLRVIDGEDDDKDEEEVKAKVQESFPDRQDELFTMMLKCVKEKRKYMNVFDPDRGIPLEDAILKAMLRNEKESKHAVNVHDEPLNVLRMNILLAWRRVDIAKKRFKTHIESPSTDSVNTKLLLRKMCISSLLQQAIKFFYLAINTGFGIKNFDKEMLSELYWKVYQSQDNVTNQRNMLLSFESDGEWKKGETDILAKMEKILNNCATVKVIDYYSDPNKGLSYPYKDIFLWAVICNKYKVALSIWYNSDHPIGLGLIARVLYMRLSTYYDRYHHYFDEGINNELQLNARLFGKAAFDLLDTCSESSTSYTNALVNIKIPMLANLNCMGLASLSEYDDFIAHQRCRDVTNMLWAGKFDFYGPWLYIKVVLSILCPPLIFTIAERKQNEFYTGGPHMDGDDIKKAEKTAKKSGFVGKIRSFYSAPLTKFWILSIINMCFLCVYAVFVLFHMEDTWPVYEYVVCAYVVSFALTEVFSLRKEYGITMKQKIRRRTSSYWRNLNSLCVIVYVVALMVRLISQHAPMGKSSKTVSQRISTCFYALSFFLWVLRLLQIISLNRKIGVYIIMLQKMTADVVYFIAIALVFITGYGIVFYLTKYSTQATDNNILRHIFLVPAYQILGQMIESSQFPSNYDTYKVFMMFFTYIYLIFTTLLLLNLLIAVFNNTYEDVRVKADRIWKWEHYRTVMSYTNLYYPWHIVTKLFRWMRDLCRTNRSRMYQQQDYISMAEYFEKERHITFLTQFEKECLLHNKRIDEMLKKKKKKWKKVMKSDVSDFVECLNETFQEDAQ